MRILLVALGDDQAGDAGVGLAAARLLRKDLRAGVDFAEAPSFRGDSLARLAEYESVLILGYMESGGVPGTLLEFTTEDGPGVLAPPAHCSGLIEILRGRAEGPRRAAVLAVEIAPDAQSCPGLSPAAAKMLPFFVLRARQILEAWQDLDSCTIATPEIGVDAGGSSS